MRDSFIKQAFMIFVCVLVVWTMQQYIVAYAYTGNGDLIVHVTRTGSCYHTASCGALRSDIEIPLEEAYIKGYQPCDLCNPPLYTGDAERGVMKEKNESNSTNTGSGKNHNTSSSTNGSKRRSSTVDSSFSIPIPILCGIGGILVILLSVRCYGAFKEWKLKLLEEQKNQIRRQEEYEARKRYYEENYKGKSIHDIVGAPIDVSIDSHGGVVQGLATKEKPYGELTVYVSSSGYRYHKNPRCGSAYGLLPVNKYHAMLRGYSACGRCMSKAERLPVPDWYRRIPQVLSSFEEFENKGTET